MTTRPLLVEPGKVNLGYAEVGTFKGKDQFAKVTLAEPTYRSKLEKRYAKELEAQRHGGEIQRWWWEPLTFNLPGGQRYKPDFLVITKDGRLVFHEVKGWSRNIRDGMSKLKTAAALTPWAEFLLIQRQRGAWTQKQVA